MDSINTRNVEADSVAETKAVRKIGDFRDNWDDFIERVDLDEAEEDGAFADEADVESDEEEERNLEAVISFFEGVEERGNDAIKENEEFLQLYEDDLRARGVNRKDRRRQVFDVEYFLDDFLAGYGHRIDIGVDQVAYFLEEWMIKKNPGIEPDTITRIGDQLIDFHKSMLRLGRADEKYVKDFVDSVADALIFGEANAERALEGDMSWRW